jgi:hypothetical protein
MLLVVVGSLLVTGCGGGGAKKASPGEYVSTICTSINTWQTGVALKSKALSTLYQRITANPDLKQIKVEVIAFVNGLIKSTEKLQTNIEAAGEPDVDNGAEIEMKLNNGVAGLVKALKAAKARAMTIPTNDAAAFAGGVQSLVASFTRALSSLGSSLSTLKSPELKAAAAKDPTCQKLG